MERSSSIILLASVALRPIRYTWGVVVFRTNSRAVNNPMPDVPPTKTATRPAGRDFSVALCARTSVMATILVYYSLEQFNQVYVKFGVFGQAVDA